MRRGSAGLLVLLLSSLSCESPTPAESVPPCQPGVEISASGGVEPTFSWTPACRVTALEVESFGFSWRVLAAGDGLLPPLRYGHAPEGAIAFAVPGGPLTAGTEYIVRLERSRSPVGTDTIAWTTFIP